MDPVAIKKPDSRDGGGNIEFSRHPVEGNRDNRKSSRRRSLPRRLPAPLEHGRNSTSCAGAFRDRPGSVTIVAENRSGRGSRPPIGSHRSR